MPKDKIVEVHVGSCDRANRRIHKEELAIENYSNMAKDHWSSKAYEDAAGFVPKLTSKVVSYLDVKPNDRILDGKYYFRQPL